MIVERAIDCRKNGLKVEESTIFTKDLELSEIDFTVKFCIDLIEAVSANS
jgi:hypothetical protein